MIPTELLTFFETFVEEQRSILDAKGDSYAGTNRAADSGDRLANFKRVAERSGMTPAQCWLVYFLKHVDSISTYVRTGHESEGPRSRLLDIANYAILGAALLDERTIRDVSNEEIASGDRGCAAGVE